MNLEKCAKIARVGDKILEKLAVIIAILIIIFAGYSIYDNWRIANNSKLSEELMQYKPDPRNTFSLAELKKKNKDTCAWITVKKTNIDYPVVKGKDNLEYINKDIFGEFSYSGTVFLDSQNSAKLDDPYMILYGHNLSHGHMFGDVEKFTDIKYLKNHQKGYLYGDGYRRNIKFFACATINSGDTVIYNIPYWKTGDRTELIAYIKTIAKSYISNVIKPGDEIVVLSTCIQSRSNGRTVLFGRLSKEKEKIEKKHDLK